MTPDQLERYKRHLLVKEIGGPGQKKLLNAHVTIVGAGALGGVAAQILTAAGVGKLSIYDDDRVELSNLQRQTQFVASDVGSTKVGALFRMLSRLNHDVRVTAHQERWVEETGVADTDLVIDGSDNFPTRFALNRVTRAAGVPLISGAVAGWTGQVISLNPPGDPDAPCYQCLVPEEPPQAGDCNDLGVLGAVTHLTASHLALLAIRYVLGETRNMFSVLTIMEGLAGQTRAVFLPKDPACSVCGAD